MRLSLRHSIRWSIFISVFTFFMACAFSIAAATVLEGVSWGICMLIVFLLISIGILFDMMSSRNAEQRWMNTVRIVLYMGKFFYILESRLGIQLQGKIKNTDGKRGNKRATRTS